MGAASQRPTLTQTPPASPLKEASRSPASSLLGLVRGWWPEGLTSLGLRARLCVRCGGWWPPAPSPQPPPPSPPRRVRCREKRRGIDMTEADFAEAMHARHSSARKGEATAKELFNPVEFSVAASCLPLLFPHLPPGIRATHPPVPSVCPSLAQGPEPLRASDAAGGALLRLPVGGATWRSLFARNLRASCGPPVLAFVCQGQVVARGRGAASFRDS